MYARWNGTSWDLETVDTSLKAAETGHLVFSTIHTSDVASTINRLVSFFPTEEQGNVRARLADNVKAIVSLRLLVNKKETGRVPAVEIMRRDGFGEQAERAGVIDSQPFRVDHGIGKAAAPGEKSKKWLDVEGGPFQQGEGTFEPGFDPRGRDEE